MPDFRGVCEIFLHAGYKLYIIFFILGSKICKITWQSVQMCGNSFRNYDPEAKKLDKNINICLSHVPTPPGATQKEAGRVCVAMWPPLYAAGACCVCVRGICAKVARVGRWCRWCDGWHGLGWFVCCCCVCGWFTVAKGYSCAGCYAVNVFVCVCAYMCAAGGYMWPVCVRGGLLLRAG